MMYRAAFPSPLGTLTMYSNGSAITAITLPVWRHQPIAESTESKDLTVFQQAKSWLENYFTGTAASPIPPIQAVGTTFQQQVWTLLREIPRGSTLTYGDVARKLEERTGHHTSPRAVGNAVGRNPVAIMIPCHRVLGTGGSLTGFGGGLEAKRFLLELEGIPYHN